MSSALSFQLHCTLMPTLVQLLLGILLFTSKRRPMSIVVENKLGFGQEGL